MSKSMMQSKGTLFTYLEMSKDCKEASSIIDIQQPHFARTMKKVMRKITKGDTHICRPIKKLVENGESVPSGYEIVGSLQNEPHDLLLAYLPGASGDMELYRFPFVRLVVRKVDDAGIDDKQPSLNPPDDYSLKSIAERLDQLTSSLAPLVSPKTPKPRRSRANTANRTSIKATVTKMPLESTVNTSDKAGVAHTADTNSNTLNAKISGPQSSAVSSTSLVGNKVPFMDSLNDTIDNVLSRIRSGKDDQLFSNLETKLYTNLDALPPLSAQSIDRSQHSLSVADQTNKISRKKVLSPPDLNQSQRSESLHTTIRFTPITSRSSDLLDGQFERGSPELLSLELPNEEGDHGVINFSVDNEQLNSSHLKSKPKAVSAKRRRRDGPCKA